MGVRTSIPWLSTTRILFFLFKGAMHEFLTLLGRPQATTSMDEADILSVAKATMRIHDASVQSPRTERKTRKATKSGRS